MQKIKSKITEITSFNKLYGFCTLLTVIWFAMTIGVFYFCIIKWLGMPFAETGYSGWKDLSDYSYSVCAIAATIAVVSHTTLTVLISTSKNKTFGIELKEFLRNCKWRLRPFTTFGVSILTVLWCVAIAVCERPDFLMLLLVWLIIYIGCYSLMVWKLSINVGFAADFFRKFFKKTKQTELLKEREQVVSKIFSQLSGLDEGEQKYGIAIIAELVQNSNKEVWDFYKQELENTFHKQIEENENFDLENNIFRNLCELLVCDNFSYCTLLINTYSAVKSTNKESKEKCRLLKKIKEIITSLPIYKEIAKFFSENGINEKQDDEYIMQFLRNSFTENLDQNGFVFACKEMSRDSASMGIDEQEIKKTYIEIYKRLQSASPEYFGKYEMSRHFSEFRDVFFAHSKEYKYYSLELAWDIIYNYIKSLMINTSLIIEKQCRILTSFVAAGVTPFNNQWKDEYIPINEYQKLIRKAFIYCEIQIFGASENPKRQKQLLEALLVTVNQNKNIIGDLCEKVYSDLFIMLGIAWGIHRITCSEVKDILKFEIGVKRSSLGLMFKRMWKMINTESDIKIHNEILKYLGKPEISDYELIRIKLFLKQFKNGNSVLPIKIKQSELTPR